MDISQDQFKAMLVLPEHITEEQFVAAVAEAEKRRISISEQILNDGLLLDKELGQVIADFYDHRFVDLQEIDIKKDYLEIIPEIVAHSQRVIVYDVNNEEIVIATEFIDNYEFFHLLEKKTGKEVKVFYASTRGVNHALKYYKGDLRERITELIEACSKNYAEADVVKFVNLLLEYANDSGASDIHMEPQENYILVRFRIDGILYEAVRYPNSLHERIVFRIKIMSHMQTDERATAQDGRFEYHQGENNIFDVRVSILPITDGENLVMRLLDTHIHRFSLENLGLSEVDYKKILAAIERPHGMIISAGPTGSGKTTVLYTIIEKLQSSEVNIMTIEDPVEYDIQGVQQTQVNQKKNLTFANGLRSIVRQDPDIIMVGEMRDSETADIAINSALTGHLVVSTLHANDAATVFPRLTEMNVEPFLIASSVNIIIALRLVRKICSHCRESYVISQTELEILNQNAKVLGFIEGINQSSDLSQLRLYRGKGCKTCHNSGYDGRIGIFEVLQVDDDIRLLITKKSSADVINDQALQSGMKPILYDGVTKALNGTTTIEEVIKVIGV